MALIDDIQNDAIRITSNLNEFGTSVNFKAPTSETITITAIWNKHHLGVDTDGNMVNSMKASVSFSESLMVGYPVRKNGIVDLNNHIITVKGIKYKTRQWFPDETLGLIVVILEYFK